MHSHRGIGSLRRNKSQKQYNQELQEKVFETKWNKLTYNQKYLNLENSAVQEYYINCNCIFVGDICDLMPELQGFEPNIISNNGVFENIKADKIGFCYIPKINQFAWLALNDDYTAMILFKSSNIYDLPYISQFMDPHSLNGNVITLDNWNKRIHSTYKLIHDITVHDPILVYRVGELWRK